jgi:GntR family transcriptional regulator
MEIMEHYSLSRTTIRQALNDLVKDNVLYRKKGIGTFVSIPKIDLRYLENSLDFTYQILRMGLVPSTKVLELTAVKADEKLAREMGISSGDEVVFLKRLRFAEQEPIVVVASYLPYSHCSFIMDVNLEKESLYQTLALKENTKVVRVERFVEAQLANPEDCKLMQIRKGFPIQNFINKAYNRSGDIMEYCIARYRGDRNIFYVNIDVK